MRAANIVLGFKDLREQDYGPSMQCNREGERDAKVL